MHAPKALLMIVAASALIAVSIPSVLLAENFFAQSLAELSNADRQAMERARLAVLDKKEQGAVEIWKDDRTGHAGEARVRRTYERNGMNCADVEHIVKLPKESRFVIPFCLAGDGTWRAAF